LLPWTLVAVSDSDGSRRAGPREMRRSSSPGWVDTHPLRVRWVVSRAGVPSASWPYLWNNEMSSTVDDFAVEFIDDGGDVTFQVIAEVDLAESRVVGGPVGAGR
jgi:hypothetical protein